MADFPWAAVDAHHLLEYQDLPAIPADQTGSLHRNQAVQTVENDRHRRAAWTAVLRAMSVPDGSG